MPSMSALALRNTAALMLNFIESLGAATDGIANLTRMLQSSVATLRE
jgi:hypothetical protein